MRAFNLVWQTGAKADAEQNSGYEQVADKHAGCRSAEGQAVVLLSSRIADKKRSHGRVMASFHQSGFRDFEL
jgi:hypothetical protein